MNQLTVPILYNMCKRRNMKGLSKCKKQDLASKLIYYVNITKIQKWFRKILIKGNQCPISLDTVVYPCYAFYMEKSRLFIYYNLNPLKDFLISTGDFRDPKTRIPYTKKQLMDISNDVYKASKNISFYKKKEACENEILFLERYMDELTQYIIDLVENPDMYRLETIYFNSYKIQYKRLEDRSKEHALYVLNKSIQNINFVIDNGIVKKIYNHKQMFIRDHIIQFLYSLEY